DLLVGELHVLVLGELVALHHLVALDHLAVLLADVLLLQARATTLVQQVEGNGVGCLGGGVQLDRNGHQAEGDGQGTDGAHGHEEYLSDRQRPSLFVGVGYFLDLLPKAFARLCFAERTSCHRSPVLARRAGTFRSGKWSGSAASSSSHVSGMETGAPGTPRGE